MLTFLGQSAAEAQTAPPWYQRPPPRRNGGGGDEEEEFGEGGARERERKAALDPLRDIRRALGAKGGGEERSGPPPSKGRRGETKPPPKCKGAPPRGLEALRAERLKREMEERARERALREGRGGGGGAAEEEEEEEDERKRPYNAQFNPRLARGGRR